MAALTSVPSSRLMNGLIDTYRRAAVEQATTVGTERVLYEHARRNSQWIRRAVTPEDLAAIRRVVETDGTEVSRDTGYLGAPASLAVESMLREARWEAFRSLPDRYQEDQDRIPQWTDGLRAAVAEALATAASHGAERAHGGHLLLGLLSDSDSGASRLLAVAGVDRAAAIDALSADEQLRQSAEPWLPAVEILEATGVISINGTGPWYRPLFGVLAWFMGRLSSGIRRAGGHGNPVAACLQIESIRQAVRLGDATVGPRHVLLAMLSLDDQLSAAARGLPRRIARQNTAGALLAEQGVRFDRVVAAAIELGPCPTEGVTEAPGLIFAPEEPETPPWTVTGAAIWGSARAHADRSGHKGTGTAHVLLALLDDPSGEAVRLLQAGGADPDRIWERLTASLAAASTA